MRKKMRLAVYITLVLGTACVSFMGYRQVTAARAEKVNGLSACWVPKDQITRLMHYHCTDGLKVTRDEVFIFRDARWIPVMKRQQI